MKLNPNRYLFLAGMLVLLAASCGRKNPESGLSTPTSGKVALMADESFNPVVASLVQVFNGIYPYASVSCEYRPETDVINALLKGDVPMVLAARNLTSREKEYFLSKKLFPRENLFAMDGIALIVNPTVKDSLISTDQIRQMLSGEKRTWKQVGLAAETDSIRVVFDHTGSGTVRFMLDSVCSGRKFGPGVRSLTTNTDVVRFVAKNPGAVGIIGSAIISSSRDQESLELLRSVKVLYVSRTHPALPGNSYPPYQAFVSDGKYPLRRFLYLINAEPRNGLATGFASMVCSERGQRIILKSGIMPATEPTRNVLITN